MWMPRRPLARERVEEVRHEACPGSAPIRSLANGSSIAAHAAAAEVDGGVAPAPRRAGRGRRRTGAMPARSPSARSSAWPSTMRDVLDGVVLVDPQVARAGELEVDQRVRRERGQHVVEHADPRRHRRRVRSRRARRGSGRRSRPCGARRCRSASRPAARRSPPLAPSAARSASSSAGVAGLTRMWVASSGSAKVRTTRPCSSSRLRDRSRRLAEVDEQEVRARVLDGEPGRAERRRHAVALGDGRGGAWRASRRPRGARSRRAATENDEIDGRRPDRVERGGRSRAARGCSRSAPRPARTPSRSVRTTTVFALAARAARDRARRTRRRPGRSRRGRRARGGRPRSRRRPSGCGARTTTTAGQPARARARAWPRPAGWRSRTRSRTGGGRTPRRRAGASRSAHSWTASSAPPVSTTHSGSKPVCSAIASRRPSVGGVGVVVRPPPGRASRRPGRTRPAAPARGSCRTAAAGPRAGPPPSGRAPRRAGRRGSAALQHWGLTPMLQSWDEVLDREHQQRAGAGRLERGEQVGDLVGVDHGVDGVQAAARQRQDGGRVDARAAARSRRRASRRGAFSIR